MGKRKIANDERLTEVFFPLVGYDIHFNGFGK